MLDKISCLSYNKKELWLVADNMEDDYEKEKALIEQSEFACVQSHVAESRYWDIGKKIGEAYVKENYDKNTWAEFLKEQMDELRTPKEEIIYG